MVPKDMGKRLDTTKQKQLALKKRQKNGLNTASKTKSQRQLDPSKEATAQPHLAKKASPGQMQSLSNAMHNINVFVNFSPLLANALIKSKSPPGKNISSYTMQ